LSSMAVHVSRARVREAMISSVGRRQLYRRIARRVYSVRGPLSLVHLDGNHKLIGQVIFKVDIIQLGYH
jgi:FKBP-type peptidyl-prolyl cis-trans isomerase 2